jgi:hypothetical protein
MSSDATDREPVEESGLIGAADVVAAFTALRHELKLQVRAGRDLAAGLEGLVDAGVGRSLADVAERLSRMEAVVHAAAASATARPAVTGGTDACRPMATALAEVEESLERAVAAIAGEAETIGCLATEFDAHTDGEADDPDSTDPAAAWDACLAESSWLVRTLAAGLVGRLRQIFDIHLQQAIGDGARRAGKAQEGIVAAATALADTGQGLELALVRTRRLMEQAGLRRIDVLHEPFDAERMRAIDIAEDAAVPEGHVAKQFRPGYVLHGAVLRPAEVGVAR